MYIHCKIYKSLWLEELRDRPSEAWHFADLSDGRRPRAGPVQLLSYEAVIHIDQIVDFRPSATSSSKWPARHSFTWRLGFRDDWTRPPPRRSIHERFGCHKRDRSPSGEGGADGADNYVMFFVVQPPPPLIATLPASLCSASDTSLPVTSITIDSAPQPPLPSLHRRHLPHPPTSRSPPPPKMRLQILLSLPL
jgi:hypothetical protein